MLINAFFLKIILKRKKTDREQEKLPYGAQKFGYGSAKPPLGNGGNNVVISQV